MKAVMVYATKRFKKDAGITKRKWVDNMLKTAEEDLGEELQDMADDCLNGL